MMNEDAIVPDWDVIQLIGNDLRVALDEFSEGNNNVLPNDLRFNLASTIASMRAEKFMNGKVDTGLLHQLQGFHLNGAGIVD